MIWIQAGFAMTVLSAAIKAVPDDIIEAARIDGASGMRLFWSVAARATPRLRVLEAAPVAALVVLCLGLGVGAGPVARYLDATAHSLHQPATYVRTVLAARSHDSAVEEP